MMRLNISTQLLLCITHDVPPHIRKEYTKLHRIFLVPLKVGKAAAKKAPPLPPVNGLLPSYQMMIALHPYTSFLCITSSWKAEVFQ